MENDNWVSKVCKWEYEEYNKWCTAKHIQIFTEFSNKAWKNSEEYKKFCETEKGKEYIRYKTLLSRVGSG